MKVQLRRNPINPGLRAARKRGRRALRRAIRAAALGTILASGCARPPALDRPGVGAQDSASTRWPAAEPGRLESAREGCEVLGGAALAGGTFVFALGDSVLPERAPVPHNAGERIVFGNMYETLVRVDCQGRVGPGLATHWTCTQDSTVWVFTLRQDACFWDGARVTPEDVRQAWCANQEYPAGAAGGSPWTWLNARAQTVTVLDARRLAIRLPEPQADFPLLLAHPATAVAAKRQDASWPLGSGPVRPLPGAGLPPLDLACGPNPHHPAAPQWEGLVFRALPGRDPRDLAASDVDLMLVRTLSAVEFFDAAPGFHSYALPWNRLYLLVCPPLANPGRDPLWWSGAAGGDLVPRLAEVAWRPWDRLEFPVWSGGSCPQLTGPVTDRASAPVQWELAQRDLDGHSLVYLQADPVARELAEHLAARTPEAVRTVALPADQLAFALQWQMPGALILSCPQVYPTGCLQLAALLGQASWLQHAALGGLEDLVNRDGTGESGGTAAPGKGRTRSHPAAGTRAPAISAAGPTETLVRHGFVRPLGLSRSWLVCRGNLAGLALDFDGTPLLGGLGRSAAAPDPHQAPPPAQDSVP